MQRALLFARASRPAADIGEMDFSSETSDLAVERSSFGRDQHMASLPGKDTNAFTWLWNDADGTLRN